jgi:hypothetical protein
MCACYTAFACLLAASLLSTGCGTSSDESTAPSLASTEGAKYLLQDEPDGAIGVIRARETAADNDELVVVGRIGGGVAPWIDGLAAFVLVDPSSGISANDACDEQCNCHAKELAEASTVVKIVNENGQVVPVDARRLLGLTGLEVVVVKGRAKRDDAGNLNILASGIHVR